MSGSLKQHALCRTAYTQLTLTYLGIAARLIQLPSLAAGIVIANRTHHRAPAPIPPVTNVPNRLVTVHSHKSIGDNKKARKCGKHQPGCVEAEPRKIERQLLAEVKTNQVEWLVGKKGPGFRPMLPQ